MFFWIFFFAYQNSDDSIDKPSTKATCSKNQNLNDDHEGNNLYQENNGNTSTFSKDNTRKVENIGKIQPKEGGNEIVSNDYVSFIVNNNFGNGGEQIEVEPVKVKMTSTQKLKDDRVCRENLTGKSIEVRQEVLDNPSPEAMEEDEDEESNGENDNKEPKKKKIRVKNIVFVVCYNKYRIQE